MAPLRIEDLDYDLPVELIAQHPVARREDARLLVVDRAKGVLHDSRFSELGQWLRPGDALALNETRVFPARLHVRRPSGGKIELLFVRPEPHGNWRVLARPAKRVMPGSQLFSEGGELTLEVVGADDEGERIVRVIAGDLAKVLDARGEIPLPPYISRHADAADRERYQTVFARVDGAVAAPTAGLHFSDDLLGKLEGSGIERVPVVLHVGPGTFRPISNEDPLKHKMDEEWFEVPADSAQRLNAARAKGSRIVAVGTTAVRALESACDANAGALTAASGWTRKFITPPYSFQAVDALVTNFHLPRTTLLLLVAAFTGEALMWKAYDHAVIERYRFYSYGDAMLVV